MFSLVLPGLTFYCSYIKYERDHTEDDCLNSCLVQTFVKEFGCLHSRLKRLKLPNNPLMSTKICLYEDLAPKTEAYEKKLNGNRKRSVEEYGLVRIRQILSSFNQFDSPTRCNCSIKCRRNIITLTELPQPNKKVAYEFAYFQVKLLAKVHFKDSIQGLHRAFELTGSRPPCER